VVAFVLTETPPLRATESPLLAQGES
jgi:hypothetical protein